jgi:hypothetical protein
VIATLGYWFLGGFEGLSIAGIFNEVLIGFTIFILLAVNCIAAILHFKDVNKYGELARNITFLSIFVASVVILGPNILQLSLGLKGY